MGTADRGPERYHHGIQDPLSADRPAVPSHGADDRGQPAHVRLEQAREERELSGASLRVQRQRDRAVLRLDGHRDLRERLVRERGAQRADEFEK